MLDHTVLYPEHYATSPEKSPEKSPVKEERLAGMFTNYFEPTISPEKTDGWNIIADCVPIADHSAS